MTQEELKLHLESLGLPVAYSHFKTNKDTPPPTPPFIAYMFSSSSDMYADNFNYVDISTYTIELYTRKKDLVTEALLENKLKELKIPYSKLEAWIEQEKLFQVSYEIQI